MTTKNIFLLEGLSSYIALNSQKEHVLLSELREYTQSLPEARMQISVQQGQLMALLAKLMGAERYLEIGTFTGYSSLAVALVMPETAQLHCCDYSDVWTQVAKNFWAKAGVDSRITLHLDDALQSLQKLKASGECFDMAFIDADKAQYREYFDLCMQLVRINGLVLVDNTLWSGHVIDDTVQDVDTVALREFNHYLTTLPNITTSFLPVADGLTLIYRDY